MIEEGAFERTRRRRAVVGVLLAALLAFVAGGFAMAYAVRHWERLGALVRPTPAPVISAPVPLVRIAPAAPPADPHLAERVDALDDKVAEIDTQAREASGDADRAEGLLVAFAARRVIDRGQQLGFLESMLRAHFGGVEPQAVAMVIASAQRPVTLDQLQDRFAALAPSLVAPAPQQSWWTGFRRELGSLLVIRRADAPSVLPDDRRERARRELEQGQVERALIEVARLPGSPAAQDWIAAARRYVLVHNALDRIETAALLAPSPQAPAPIQKDAPARRPSGT